MAIGPRALPLSLGVVTVALLATLSGCSGGTDPSASVVTSPVTLPRELVPTTSTTLTGPSPTVTTDGSGVGPPRIEAFTVRAPLTCDPPTYGARVEWIASGAVSATILVDSAQVAGPVAVSGPFDLVLGCDGTAHTVVLVLAAPDGSTAVQTRAVLASPGG